MWLLIIQELTYVMQSVFTMNIVIGYEYSYPVTGAQDVSLNFALVPTWGIPPPLLLDLPPANLASQLPHWLCMDNQWTKTLDYKTRPSCCGAYTGTCPRVTHTHTRGWRGKVFFQLYMFFELCKHNRWTVSYTSLAGTHHVNTQTLLSTRLHTNT